MRSVLIAVSLVALLLAQAYAQEPTSAASCIEQQLLAKKVRPTRFAEPTIQPFESSVEMEIQASPSVMNLITTEDGTVGSMCGPTISFRRMWVAGDAPESIMQYMKANHIGTPEELASHSWDSLPFEVKIDLIRAATRDQSFIRNRKIPGLRLKGQVQMNFLVPTRFLGKLYPRGKQRVDLREGFLPYVEFADIRKFDKMPEVEIHLRSNRNAGENAKDAWIFERGIGMRRTHLHVHLAAPLPIEALRADPGAMPYEMTDFVRRTNLLAEMVSVLKGGIPQTLGGRFGSITQAGLTRVQDNLIQIAEGLQDRITVDEKLSFVGVRESETYDQPGFWGQEYRAIHPNIPSNVLAVILDRIQQGMIHQNYGVSRARIVDWIEKHPKVLLSNEWYARDPSDWSKYWTAHSEDPRLQIFAPGVTIEGVKLRASAPKNFQNRIWQDNSLQMLYHDWSNDPMFYDKPEAIQRIKRAQDEFFRKFNPKMSLDEELELVKEFYWESGILKATLDSFGLTDQVLPLLRDGGSRNGIASFTT